MAAGKTTISNLVAKRLSRPYRDIDDEIENEYGITIPEIFQKYGESGFREFETVVLKKVIKERPRNSIISLGGGTILKPENMEIIKKNGIVIYLEANSDTLYDRIKKSKSQRPVLKDMVDIKKDIENLLNRRKDIYKASADIIINVNGKSTFEVTMDCISKLKAFN